MTNKMAKYTNPKKAKRNFGKGVDNWREMWYYIQVAAREWPTKAH